METEALIGLQCPERQDKCITTIVSGALPSHWDLYEMCRMCSLASEQRQDSGPNSIRSR